MLMEQTPEANKVLPEPFPSLPLSYPDNVWVCPITGVRVEKSFQRNVLQRQHILQTLVKPQLRDLFVHQCSRSFLLWLNLCGWTFRQHEILPDGTRRPVKEAHVPFITWPVQDDAATQLIHCIREGKDALLDKSRDMGASWLCISILTWMLMFDRDFTAKVLSRKEEEVDTTEIMHGVRGKPDTLFWKIRYLISRQPPWMRPRLTEGYMRVMHPSMGSSIVGESTNKHAARGGRMKVVLLDECSVYADLAAIDASTESAASCRIFNATPVGPGYYSDLRYGGKIRVIVLGFWNHPEKGIDRKVVMEDGKVRWTSPARELAKKGTSPKVIAQNWDIDHERSGDAFFDLPILLRHRQVHAEPAEFKQGHLHTKHTNEDLDEALRTFRQTRKMDWHMIPSNDGPLRIWSTLQLDRERKWMPNPHTAYAMGIDIAQGVGSSNSSICIIDQATGYQVAEYTSSMIDPGQLARIAVMLGYWFRGRNECAFMAWEANGWGQTFQKVVLSLGYPWLYRHLDHRTRLPIEKEIMGWWNNRNNNWSLLDSLRDAFANNQIRIFSKEALMEGERYVFSNSGTIEPAQLEQEGNKARLTHGDRWRAVAIAWEAAKVLPMSEPPQTLRIQGTVAEQLRREQEELEQTVRDSEDYGAGFSERFARNQASPWQHPDVAL